MDLSNIFPKRVLKVLNTHENIGRSRLAELCDLTEGEARKYLHIWRAINDIKLQSATEMVTAIEHNIKDKYGDKTIEYQEPEIKKSQIETAVLLLGDIHIGKKNYFFDNNTNETILTYDFDIFTKQSQNLYERVRQIISLLQSQYHFEKLVIYFLGDIFDNDIIFKGQRFSIDMGMGEQLWRGSEIIIALIYNLLKVFPKIEIVGIIGNHGRHGLKEASPVQNNFDYHFYKILDLVFKSNKKVKVTVPEMWFYYHKIYGHTYFIHHGNDVYSWLGLPYYGISRKSKARAVEIPFDLELIGHFHTAMRIPISSHNFTIINASWIKNDIYAWEKYGVLSKPQQTFFGVSRKHPITWQFDLNLE